MAVQLSPSRGGVSSARAPKKRGRSTIVFESGPRILGTATVAGPDEGKGPLGASFDLLAQDLAWGQTSFEKAEARMLYEATRKATEKTGLTSKQIDFFISGDLLNQNITSTFTAGTIKTPFLGVFAACATCAEGLLLSAALIDGGYADTVLAGVASHYGCCERQYRYPTEYGFQRPPTAQWTVTGAAAAVIGHAGGAWDSGGNGKGGSGNGKVRVSAATVGKVYDFGQNDPYDLGSAMAGAAAETMVRHFEDTGTIPRDYDLIVTGDLAGVGKALVQELVADKGYHINDRHHDCATLIYGPGQDVKAGASGAACCALVTYSHFLPLLQDGSIGRMLLVATGALHSPTSFQQGENIPVIAHAVVLESASANRPDGG